MCTKRLVSICAKFLENILTGFWFMDFVITGKTRAKVCTNDPVVVGLTRYYLIRRQLWLLKEPLRLMCIILMELYYLKDYELG